MDPYNIYVGLKVKMKTKSFLIILNTFLIFAGCQHVQTVTKTELETAQAHWQEPKATVWYYMGSKEGYDYFIHIDIGQETIYRIVSSEMNIEYPIPYSSKRSKWQFMHWGFAAKVRELQESK
jgi:hypothetical protein